MLLLQGVPALGGVKQRRVSKTSYFEAMRQYLENCLRPKLLLITRKLYMRFRLTPRSMTWMTLNCISSNLQRIS